jgi:hypothetical protein
VFGARELRAHLPECLKTSKNRENGETKKRRQNWDKLAISDGVAVLVCGVVIGLPLAVAAIRPLTDILPDGVNPWSIGMFAVVGMVPVAIGAGGGE